MATVEVTSEDPKFPIGSVFGTAEGAAGERVKKGSNKSASYPQSTIRQPQTEETAKQACIGATTAMFSVVDGVVIKPLPYPESDTSG